jgi:hypothetical protein
MNFTSKDILDIFNAVGFESKESAIGALAVCSAFIQAGFTDPAAFAPVLKRFKLLDEKMKLQGQAASLLNEQEKKVQDLIDTTNPPIGEINNQVAAIDLELAKLQF